MYFRGLKKSVSCSVILSVAASCLLLNPITVRADELSQEELPEITDYQEETQSDSTEFSEAELTDETAAELPAESEPDMTVSDEELTDDHEASSESEDLSADSDNIDQDQYELIDTITFDDEYLIEVDIEQELQAASTFTGTTVTIPTPLSTRDCIVYNYLRARCAEIADGRRSETIINIPASALNLNGKTWTAEELGISSTVVNGQITTEAIQAVRLAITGYNTGAILNRLMYYCEQDMYWYDLTPPLLITLRGLEAAPDGSSLTLTGSVEYRLPVCSCYQDGDMYHVSSDAVARAQAATTNAQAIVDRYAGLSDIEKLEAYKEEICDLVEYNHDCITNHEPYGDPYQQLYVFDNDPNTNVVCEGYAKAFKMLCDLSDFSSDVSCILVTGTTQSAGGSGTHMWNIVRIDGVNYLIDVTNSDSNYLTQSSDLFMKSPLSGGYTTPYVFNSSIGQITYTYDLFTYQVYDPDRLTINITSTPQVNPAPQNQTGWIQTSDGWVYRNDDFTFPQDCWKKINNRWYYFDSKGIMTTGWQKVNNKWYYMNSSGAMQTGWIKLGSTWYYLDTSGAMVTGWQKIGGTWYYFNSSGAMQTGWIKQANNWYYLDTSGKMTTGWKYINGKWYYFYSSGKMAYNTTIGGYQLSSSGAMI